ncbi:hypothetical protein [Catellatospora sp. TT07R-123]|uniref:hypothetical protein n=1 Tax=Catellatospora sp. TT07R-123 TaxID=2733863 RepID=UPI001BB35EB7|nr:hypothetical protein [Catellatospora sp. TT07R-123]
MIASYAAGRQATPTETLLAGLYFIAFGCLGILLALRKRRDPDGMRKRARTLGGRLIAQQSWRSNMIGGIFFALVGLIATVVGLTDLVKAG